MLPFWFGSFNDATDYLVCDAVSSLAVLSYVFSWGCYEFPKSR